MRATAKLLLGLLALNSCLYNCANEAVEEETTTANTDEHLTQIYRKNMEKMRKIIKDRIRPCDNFFEHACGNFLNDEKNAEYIVPPYLYNIQDRMEFFVEQRASFSTAMGKMLSDMYDDCKLRESKSRGVGESPGLKRWRSMLQQIDFLAQHAKIYRHWPYLRFQWEQLEQRNSIMPNWIKLAATMAAHGLPTILHIYFAEQTIYIEPVKNIQCPTRNEFSESLRPILRKRNAQIADIVANELWHFCLGIQGVEEEQLDVLTANVTLEDVTWLIDDLTNIYFQSFFTSLNLTENEIEQARKLPMDVQRINRLLKFLRFSSERVVTNYLLWHAYTTLTYEDCYQLTEEFGLLRDAEYWQWHAFEPYIGRNVALATYLYHTTRFQKQRKQMLMSEYWYKFLFVQLQRRDFNLERIMQQYAATNWQPAQLAEYFNDTLMRPQQFYGNLLALKRQQLRYSFYTPYVDADDVNHPSYFLHRFFNFCISLTKQPFYYYYASEGFGLWQAARILVDSDGYYTALDCLERQTMLHADDSSIYRKQSDMEVEETFHFYRAFIEVLRDYKFWLAGESFAFTEDFILEYFNLNSEQIMFYAVTQMYCGRNDILYASQINRAFMNMPEFQLAFNCSADDTMNPPVKCMVRQCQTNE